MYDDFTELRPGAAKELELALASPNQQRPIYQGQGTNGPYESGQTLGTGSDEPFSFALAPIANLQDSASRTFYDPRPGHSQSTSGTIPCNLESKWLLVCARAAQRPTSLFHMDVGSTTSDQQLFAKLRQIYVQAKKASYRSLSFKTVRSIRFVQVCFLDYLKSLTYPYVISSNYIRGIWLTFAKSLICPQKLRKTTIYTNPAICCRL